LTLLAQAELHVATSDSDTARLLLDVVTDICTPLAARPALARAAALATRLNGVPLPRPSYPASLTPREVEILRLLVTGQTNRDIAEALLLSERTVEVHVRHILTKTNTDNRTEAAAFALRHGLA